MALGGAIEVSPDPWGQKFENVVYRANKTKIEGSMDIYQLLNAMKQQQMGEIDRRAKDWMYPNPNPEQGAANQMNLMRLGNLREALNSDSSDQRDMAAQALSRMQMMKAQPAGRGPIRFRSR